MTAASAERRARWLVRCYPPAWRARYGEEFVQLLLDDMAERPRSAARTVDVMRRGLLARAAVVGLVGDGSEADGQLRAGLTVLAAAMTIFLTAAAGLWAQLTIGWQWSAPATPATRSGMLLMSGAMMATALLTLLVVAPFAWSVCREMLSGRGRRLAAPAVLFVAGGAVLLLGSIHFGHGWPGTGGHPWAGRDVVPASVARVCWAATLWITSYWAHPGALSTFPGLELAWMVISPAATLAMLLGAAGTLRRLPLSPRVLRYEARLGLVGGLGLAVVLAGAGSWIVSGGPGPRGLFRVGAIDVVALGVMTAALIVVFAAARRSVAAAHIGPPGT